MSKVEFDLPQLVVVGSQSSGKSSVVEALVGKDFLPRGRGIVTRVPLILQLVKTMPNESLDVWAEFTHDLRFRGRRFLDFAQVKATIEEETSRLAGKGKGVANTPLVLRVHSPATIPLTLVDTPGLTRVAVGEQPADIEKQIRAMVSSYIEKPNSIILAVSAANQDIATSDALRLARQYDPAGERTIGVLTKLDIMDKGTDALDVLSGRLYPLRLGFVGVVCRSQHDIDAGKTLEEALEAEQTFFLSSPSYRSVADVNGSKYLAQKCNRLLIAHIRKTLPKLKVSIKEQIATLEADLQRIGEAPPPDDPTQKGYLLLRLITNFSTAFKSAIDGNGRNENDSFLTTRSGEAAAGIKQRKLNGGARIRHIFNDVFDKALQKIDPLEGLDDQDIQAAIRNAAGPKPAIFLPEGAFEGLAKRQIRKLREPALECADRVYNELLKIMLEMDGEDQNGGASGPGSGVVAQYANLSEKIVESGQKMLRKTMAPTHDLIKEVVAAECSYINTNHRDFIGLQMLHDPSKFATQGSVSSPSSSPVRNQSQASSSQQQQHSGGFFSRVFGSGSSSSSSSAEENSSSSSSDISLPSTPSEREVFQINLLKTLLRSYFELVRKNVQDITVKIVWRNVVEKAKEDMYKQLMHDLYRPENFAVLLRENPQVASQRKIFRERLIALREAKEVLKQENRELAD